MPGFDLATLQQLATEGQTIISDVASVVSQGQALIQGFQTKSKFDLNTFRSTFVNRDPALTSHYFVTIPLSQKDSRLVSFACVRAELPGITFNTTETRRYGVGPMYSYPTANIVDTINFSFLGDSTGAVQNFFHSWMGRIFDFDVSKDKFYVAEYKNNYVSDIKIELYSRKKDLYYTYTLINAYPIAIGNAQVAWEGSQILQIPVSFKFDTYRFEKSGSTLSDVNGILSAVNIPGAGQIGDAVSSILRVPQTIHDIQNQIGQTTAFLGGIFNGGI